MNQLHELPLRVADLGGGHDGGALNLLKSRHRGIAGGDGLSEVCSRQDSNQLERRPPEVVYEERVAPLGVPRGVRAVALVSVGVGIAQHLGQEVGELELAQNLGNGGVLG